MKAVFDLPEPHARVLALLLARIPPAEFLGDVRHRSSKGTWELPPDIQSVLVSVEWRDLSVPVLSPAHEALAYEKMGRTEKAERIRAGLQQGIS